jgi:hypothetical protein
MVTRNLVRVLKSLNITRAYFKGDLVVVYLEGRTLPQHRVKIVESEEWVGSWWKERAQNVIRVNSKIQEKNWLLSLATHEIVEKWLMCDSIWKLPYRVAHPISNTIEKKWHIRKWGLKSWNSYMRKVERVWEQEQKRIGIASRPIPG